MLFGEDIHETADKDWESSFLAVHYRLSLEIIILW